jgi:hypothetical protein
MNQPQIRVESSSGRSRLFLSAIISEKRAQDATFAPQHRTVCVGGKRTGEVGNEAGNLSIFRHPLDYELVQFPLDRIFNIRVMNFLERWNSVRCACFVRVSAVR